MVRGLSLFREHFRDFPDEYVVIGGVACDEWFASLDLRFRATKDIDLVLIIEALSDSFVERLWAFIKAGGYGIRQKSNDHPIYYRFAGPVSSDYPAMLEIFSRRPGHVDLAQGQQIVPIGVGQEAKSLSAILMDDDYYNLIRSQSRVVDGLPIVGPEALIPLKARAWTDLTRRRDNGEPVDSYDILKHRNDAFRLATTLPGDAGPGLVESIREDMVIFLGYFPPDSTEWDGILASLARGGIRGLRPESLREVLGTYFQL